MDIRAHNSSQGRALLKFQNSLYTGVKTVIRIAKEKLTASVSDAKINYFIYMEELEKTGKFKEKKSAGSKGL